MGVRIRAASDDDRMAVRELCVAALDADEPENAEAFPAVLARRPHHHLVAVDPDEGVVGTAIGSVQQTDDGRVGHIDLLAVLPTARGRGIGRELLAALEAELRSAGCVESRFEGNPPSYAWAGIDTRYTRAICLAESAGYVKTGDALNMHADLAALGSVLDTSDDERRLAESGIEVRRLAASDVESIRPWLDGWGGSWAAEALAGLAFDPVRCHIAREARSGAWWGFAAWGCTGPTLFGPMGTEATARRHGIGSVLLRRCLADQRDAGFARTEIGWTGPYRFYARAVHARITRTFWLYRKEL